MLPDPFPDPDPADDSGEPHDGPEPGDGLPPGGLDDEAPQQGLFLSVPAGHFDPDRFAQSGPAAEMPPDALLATIMDTVTSPDGPGVAGLGDDQLIGVIAAARRLESRAAWYVLAAEAEFTARSTSEEFGPQFAADELACELHLTAGSAARQMDYADTVTARLPQCLAALYDGRMHPVHLRIIEEETRILSAEDAAKADTVLAGIAGSLTYGKLRSAVHRLVLELDPESAARRKDAARRDALVRPFREDSGNAGLIGRELPPDEVLASWQHVEQRALDLRAAGVPGTLQELRVRGYLDLLQERDTRLDPAVRTRPVTRRQPALGAPPSLVPGRTTGTAQTETTAALAQAAAPLLVPRAARPAAGVPAAGPVQVPGRAWPRWSASPFRGPPTPAEPMAWPTPAGSG